MFNGSWYIRDHCEEIQMARPIKETPVLTGKCAREFQEAADRNLKDKSNRVSKDKWEKSKALYERMRANANF